MPIPTLRSWLCAGALLALAPAAAADFVTFGNGWGSKWDDPVHPNPAVVTWGFVPDGTAMDPSFPLAPEVTGTSQLGTLRSTVDTEYGVGAFDAAVQRAFDTWELVAGVEFVGPVAGGGLAIGAAGATSPDLRVGAFAAVPGSGFSGLGAVGYGPPGDDLHFPDPVAGDLIFNLSSAFAIHPGAEGDVFYTGGLYRNDLEGLVLHELGHAAMGLGHPAAGVDEVMYVGTGCCVTINRIPSPDDIDGAQTVYGNSATPACDNGIDDDGDGLVDYAVPGGDRGCASAAATLEDPACDDDIDNDNDGKIDWDGGGSGSPDPQCTMQPWGNTESGGGGGCGLGAELLAVLPLLRGLRRRAPRA